MKTTLELLDDLVTEIKLLAVHEGKKLMDAVADLLRQGLAASAAGSGTVLKPDKTMLKRRKALTKKFVAGEWGLELTGYEAAREAERRSAEAREKSWRLVPCPRLGVGMGDAESALSGVVSAAPLAGTSQRQFGTIPF